MAQELKDTSLYADANLKAYYRFESGALTTDSSTGGHTLTAISDPAEGTGKFGGGVDLDGNDAYSSVDHADFKPTGAFSVGGWYKTTGTSFQVLFASYSANSNYAGIHMGTTGTTYYPYISSNRNTGTTENTDYVNCIGTKATNDNSWHFMVGVWNTSSLLLYVDGALANSVSWANAPGYAGTNYVRVGCRNTTGTDASFFTGSLDDLFLLNGTALTASQVANLYDRGIKKINGVYMGSQEIASTRFATDTSLKAYYRFNTGALTTDSSGNGYTLTNNNSVAEGTGKFGGGADLGASNSNKYLSITNDLGITNGAGTIIGWVKLNTEIGSGTYDFVYKGDVGTQVAFRTLYEYNSGTRRFRFGRQKVGVAFNEINKNVTLGTSLWHQFAVTYDGTNVVAYHNGESFGTIASSGNGTSSSADITTIGADLSGNNLASAIFDDVAIFSRALTSDEIYSLYKTGVKKLNGQVNLNPELESTSLRSDANLVSYWRMEDVNDSKGSNNLTNNGTATFVSGKFNNGVNLVATSSQFLSIADASQTGLDLSTDFTISAWVKIASLPSTLGTAFAIVAKDDASGQRSYHFRILNSDKLACAWFNGANSTDPVSTSAIVTAADIGQWVHLVVTTDISVPSAIMYKNGVVVPNTQASSTATAITNSTADFRIGDLTTAAHNYFNGMIDDVAIFSRALTSTEISNLYNTNIKKYNSVSNV